jgi:hypothetical protein
VTPASLPPPERIVSTATGLARTFGVFPSSSLRWPAFGPLQAPDDVLDYGYDATLETRHGNDPIQSLSLSIAPSGDGEMTASNLAVTGNLITVWMAGGVAGRLYLVSLEITLQSGRVFGRLIEVPIDPELATFPPVPPPTPGFGAPIAFAANGTLARAGQYLTLSTLGEWPTSSAGLLPGAFYAGSETAPAFVTAVPGFGHVPGAPVFFGEITAGDLLALGAMTLPQSDPFVRRQIFLNGDRACVSLG